MGRGHSGAFKVAETPLDWGLGGKQHRRTLAYFLGVGGLLQGFYIYGEEVGLLGGPV